MNVLEAATAHWAARPVCQVEAPEWGITVYFKTPNGMQLAKVNRESKGEPIEAAARLVAECAMDGNGQKLFKPLDYKDLLIRCDPAVVSRIANAIMAEAKLDAAKAEKNSEAIPSA
jgi:hypothetical protein